MVVIYNLMMLIFVVDSCLKLGFVGPISRKLSVIICKVVFYWVNRFTGTLILVSVRNF